MVYGNILLRAAAFIASWQFVSHPTGAPLHLASPSHASTAKFCRHQVQLRCAADKGGGRAVEATVTTPIHPPASQTVKHCLLPFSCSAAVCFNQWRGVTSGEAKVPAVTFRPAPGVTDAPSTSTTSKQRETPASSRCLNQLFVVLSFHFGLGPAKPIRAAELH